MSPVIEYGPVERVHQHADTGLEVHLHKQRAKIGPVSLTRKWAGNAPPAQKIVLVHGFAQNRYTWHSTGRSPSAWFANEGFDVWNLELRGHGLSRGGGSADRFADYVDDAAAVSDALGPAFWIGHSLGGAVGYAAATQSSMAGMIGIGGLYSFAQANRTLKALCQLSTALGVGGGASMLGALNIRMRLAGKLIGRLYSVSDIAGYAFPISGWAPGSVEPELLAERLERGFDWTSLSVWMEMARWGAGSNFDYDAQWRTLDLPLLVIAGDLDHLMLPDDARVAYDRSGSTDKTFLLLDDYKTGHHWGHLDMISGRYARRWVWEPIAAWIRARIPA